MDISISSIGTTYRYTVSFERADIVSLERFLSSTGVYLSNRQLKVFSETGTGIEFSINNGRASMKTCVKDITEETRINKFRTVVSDFKERWSVDKVIKNCDLFIHQARRLERIADKLGVDVNF